MTPEPEKAPPPPDVAPPYQEIVPDDTPRTYWRLGDPGAPEAAMTDRPRTWTLYGWKYCTLSPAEVLGSRVPRGERVRVVEVLDPEAMLAWALRNAGRERVVPIIERAVWKAHQSMLPTDSIAEAVFDALNRGEDT